MDRLNNTTRRAALLALAFIVVAGLGLAGCDDTNGAEEDVATEDGPAYTVGEPLEDTSVAIVVSSEYGTDTVTTAEFRAQMQRIAQQAPQMGMDPSQPAPMRRILVESFVERHVVSGAAEAADIAVDTAAVSQQIAQIQSQYGGEEQFGQMLAQQGMTMDSLRILLGEQLVQQQFIQQLADEATPPTEEEVEEFRTEQSQQISAQHILLPVGPNASEAEEDSVYALAEAVLDSAKSGVDFAALAQRHSSDGSASRGGSLGFFSRGQMVEPFADAAFALADSGDVVDEPVRTRFGYHLIRKTGEQEGTPMDTSRARRAILSQRQQEARSEGLDRLRAKATVRINPTVVEGVDLTQEASMPRG